MGIPAEKKPFRLLGVRYEERKTDPPPGLVWRKVKDKETLGSIADEYNVRAVDLMLYNWNTVDQLEVNWYLNHYMGCKQNNGKWYSFTTAADPGQILVPNYPPSLKKAPPKSVDASRGGATTLDNKLQVQVVEWLASGRITEVSGKWLYVFSGTAGVDFGAPVLPPLPGKDAPPDAQPGTAFDPRFFPGVFHLKEKPDKLEYEILITSQNKPSDDLMVMVGGKDFKGQPQYKVGKQWHFLSDPTILAKATSESRETRNTHAFRNTKAVTIDLVADKRYYFLLSPVQLGPEAIKYAMGNPSGLTPLLKPGDDTRAWDPTGGIDPFSRHNVGPRSEDVKLGVITLPVIDPYAWAENIAEEIYPDRLKIYSTWLGSIKNYTIENLKKETGWPTLDHLYVAKMLNSIVKNHPKPPDILDELKDWRKWSDDLGKWEKQLIEKNADINAEAHRSLVQLIEWLKGPAHAIIDTAILKDTTADSEVDAIDRGWGILHWSLCTEIMMALAPGVAYLKESLTRADTVPDQMVLKYFKNTTTIPKRQQVAFRYAYPGVFKLLGFKDFVSKPPASFTGTREEFLKKIAEDNQKRRDELIKLMNDFQILPFKIAPLSIPEKSGVWSWTTATTAANGMLDISDKLKTYIVEPDIKIPRLGWVTNRLADMEEWFNGKSENFRNRLSYGVSWGLKAFSFTVSTVNLVKAIVTAGYDYQKEQSTVTLMDWANVSSGSMIAIQDVLASVAALIDKDKTHIARIFPELTKPGGKFVVAVEITGVAGRVFAGINVFAMFVAGVTTLVSMTKSSRQSASVGDATSSAFYFVGAIGGAMMATGAVVLGVALIQAGGVVSATGVGATVGVVLFFIGGIIAAIGGIVAMFFSSDDYEIFARKCFFGKQGDQEPRFGLKTLSSGMVDDPDPPDWSHALKSGTNTWPIDKQKRAIHNLLGKFALRTRVEKGDTDKSDFVGSLAIEITPGLLMEDSTFEVALHYGTKGQQTSGKVRWLGEKIYRMAWVNKGGIFNEFDFAAFDIKSYQGHKNNITIFVDKVKYESKKDDLLTTVTLTYPGLTNVVKCRKLVMKPKGDHVLADNDEVTSELFE